MDFALSAEQQIADYPPLRFTSAHDLSAPSWERTGPRVPEEPRLARDERTGRLVPEGSPPGYQPDPAWPPPWEPDDWAPPLEPDEERAAGQDGPEDRFTTDRYGALNLREPGRGFLFGNLVTWEVSFQPVSYRDQYAHYASDERPLTGRLSLVIVSMANGVPVDEDGKPLGAAGAGDAVLEELGLGDQPVRLSWQGLPAGWLAPGGPRRPRPCWP